MTINSDSAAPEGLDPAGYPGWSEAERVAALESYAILDTPVEPDFDEIAQLAAEAFAAPIAVVNLVSHDRQWFKAEVGIGTRSLPLDVSVCAHAILQNAFLVVPDMTQDDRFACNPLVTVDGGLRFYAGALLKNADGLPIGTLCVLDRKARPQGITQQQRHLLEVLARQVMTQLELRKALAEQARRAAELAQVVADRSAAVRALEAIEERYTLAARATNDAVWDWDFATNNVIWNGALQESYGFAPGDIGTTGDWWLAHIHADDRDRIDRSIHAAIDGDARSWQDEYRFLRGDGSYASVLDRGHIIRDKDDRATRMIGAMLDLTERQQSRQALAISEERLRLATDAAEVGFWDVDVIHDIMIWPPIVKAMFGIAGDAPVSLQDYYEGIHPDDRDKTVTAYHAACDPKQRALYDVEYRTVGNKDGTVRWVAAKGRGVFDQSDMCVRMIGTAIDITERKRAEEALRASEARLRFLGELDEALRAATDAPDAMLAAARLLATTLQASRCAYADVDADNDRFFIRDDFVAPGTLSSAGTYSLDLFGSRAAADMRSGRTLVISDVAREMAPADGRDMFRSIGIEAIICCPLVKDGRLVAMMAVHQDRARAWRDEEVALVEAGVDRCWSHVQRVGAEARLRESEARYRTLFEAVDVGFCVVEMKFDQDRPVDYRFVESNPAFERQTGLVNAVGRWASILVPDLEQHWFELYGKVAASGEAVRFENGSQAMGRWFDVHAFPTGAPGQNRVAILFNDISARKAVEDKLRQLNETLERQVVERTAEIRLYHDIIEASTFPICAFDQDYRLIAFNKAHNDEFRRVNGFDTRLGDIFPDLFVPEQSAAMRQQMKRALAGEAFTVVETFGRPEYGQPFWEIYYTPLRNEAGHVVGAFHLATDISDRLRAEQELASAQEALRQSQKMEAMGSLTGGVAHDFNNLLTPIVGSLDMLQRKGVGNEREQRLIAGALQSAERATTLVQRLLAFARRQPLQTRPIDIAGLVSGMAELIGSTSGPQTKLVVDVGNNLPAALADQNQLEMALLNLSVNARDAMPTGGRLSITAHVQDVAKGHRIGLSPGQYICLSVSDTGTGMDAETLTRAIEPFFSTKGIGKGTGLGLSMVHGLAAQLGGALTIDSRPGLGTTVVLWLPTTQDDVARIERAGDIISSTGAGRVLLVDDEDVVRASTADMLIDLGYEVVEARSAEEALLLLNEGLKPDLLVTDHLMSGKDGTELAREALRRLPDLRPLIVSGYADVDGIAPELPRLVKPFRQADLAAILRQ
ncbi:PAS domain S-box protein [Sphingobium sp. HWE2-09]|uniref:PAS domain S-box protein n=1 Tax=Sphingobium sp. HWE2-09 TaxID=3108390 RepID=UPI002DC8E3A3|nr:PAS domain S-box protein [Sphingobium sp. HWE2-09]